MGLLVAFESALAFALAGDLFLRATSVISSFVVQIDPPSCFEWHYKYPGTYINRVSFYEIEGLSHFQSHSDKHLFCTLPR